MADQSVTVTSKDYKNHKSIFSLKIYEENNENMMSSTSQGYNNDEIIGLLEKFKHYLLNKELNERQK
jgi:uncharacterized protein (DUF1919 family)